ncbi:MAG: hypothetical protein ABIU84_17100, partial [Thermoanaerobaculia bacterium]
PQATPPPTKRTPSPTRFRPSRGPGALAASVAVFAAVFTGLWTAQAAAQTISTPPPYLRRQLTPTGEALSSVRFLWLVDRRGEWIAFIGDVEDAGAEAVYAMRRNGSALHRLSPYAPVGTVNRLELTADGRGVVYSGDLETNGLVEVWSAPFSGTPASAVKLNLPVTGAGVLYSFTSPASGRVLYLAETAGGRGIWTVPETGPAAASVKVDPGLEPGDVPTAMFLFGQPERALLVFHDASAATMRIWSAPGAGPDSAGIFLLNATPAGCETQLAAASAVGGGGGRIAWTHRCPTGNGPQYNQLWSVPLAGPAASAVSLGGAFADGGGITSVSSSLDGARIVFIADKVTFDKDQLWSVAFAGPAGSLIRLSESGSSETDVTQFEISPDGSRVAYLSDPTINERVLAWTVPIAGPSSQTLPLTTLSAASRDVTTVKFTPDGSSVVFRADFEEDNRWDLYRVPADGSEPEELLTNDGMFATGRSADTLYKLHPDGARVVYIYDEDAPGDSRGLGEQKLFGSYFQDARLNEEPVAGGEVTDFEIFPDSAGTIYLSDQNVNGRFRLYVADTRLFGDGFEDGTTSAWPDTP